MYIIKIILLFFLTLFFIYLSIRILKKINKIKVGLCTIGKEENLYVREYISHYKNYNLDKIINNDINGEKFDDVIRDYISNGFVKIIDIRGKISQQLKTYQHCLDNFKNEFDWLIFYDMDEFIYLKGMKNIKYFLSNPSFKKCQAIQLNMYFHTDNNKLYYENNSLAERFPEKKISKRGFLKTIMRAKVKIEINCPHELNKKLISCNGFGNINIKDKGLIFTNKPDFKYFYIDHYSYKSTEEFVKKIMRGSAIKGLQTEMKYTKISWYFDDNKITKAKIDLIENMTNFNLSKYRKKIKNNS